MATQTLHYHLTKPASADRVAIGDINDNSDTIDGYLYQANERADQMADDYNASETYNTGDYVRRENYLYKCNTDNTTGTWDATKWDRVKVMDEISQGGGGGSSTLAGLNDVDLSSPTDGQLLGYNATTGKWENVTGGGGGGSTTFAGLNDVNVQGVQNGDIARYNSTTGKWTDSSDLTDLELSVSQLSSSVLSIAGDVDALESTVSQMSASTLPYDNTQSGLTADKVQGAIDEVYGKTKGTINLFTFPAKGTVTEFNSTLTSILSISNISLKKGRYAFITSINATWTFGSYQANFGIKIGNLTAQGFSGANPQTNIPCNIFTRMDIPADGVYTVEIYGVTSNVSKGVTVPAYQQPNCLIIKE